MQERIHLRLLQGYQVNKLQSTLKVSIVNVYVPTTPNPTSGYTLIVPTKKIIEIDLSVDQVLKVCYFDGSFNNR